jgi:Lamin Tail Domain
MKFRRNFCAVSWVTIISSEIVVLLVAFCFPQAAIAQVVVSEIMYDAEGSDSKAEWVELQNIGSTPVDISKWKINDGSNHVFNASPKNGSRGSLIMEPGTFIVLASDAATFQQSQIGITGAVIDTVLSLTNANGVISLLNASSSVVDTALYSSALGGNGTGESLQKISGAFVPAIPTPGTTNAVVRKEIAQKPTTPKSAPKPKSITKKVPTSKSEAAIESIEREVVVTKSATSNSQVASVAIPASTGGLLSPWMFGALAVGIAGSAAALVARMKKQGEWEIEEITDDA